MALCCSDTLHSLIPDLHSHIARKKERKRYHVVYKFCFEVVGEIRSEWRQPGFCVFPKSVLYALCALDAPEPPSCLSLRFVLLHKAVQCWHFSHLYKVLLFVSSFSSHTLHLFLCVCGFFYVKDKLLHCTRSCVGKAGRVMVCCNWKNYSLCLCQLRSVTGTDKISVF